jgi:hypothetical protein
MPENQQCRTCKFWQQRFYAVGRCAREVGANAKIWCSKDDAIVMTHATFSCSEYTPEKPVEEETL